MTTKPTNGHPDSGADWAQAAFPLTGPFTAESVVEAARAVAELVRCLAHATHRPGSGCLQYAPDVYWLLGALATAGRSLDQVCQQITEWLLAIAADPTLRVDELGPPRSAVELAEQAAERTDAAATACSELATALSVAQQACSRLYHELPDTESTDDHQRTEEDQL